MIHFEQHAQISEVLTNILDKYPYFSPDITMNNLEEAYLKIYDRLLDDNNNDNLMNSNEKI